MFIAICDLKTILLKENKNQKMNEVSFRAICFESYLLNKSYYERFDLNLERRSFCQSWVLESIGYIFPM